MKNITLKSALGKTALACGIALFAGINTYAQTDGGQLAFPGAEGWGRFATGGRMVDSSIGSKVYYVTTLDDYKSTETPIEGSLRWALTDGDDTPRTILFSEIGRASCRERV